MPICPFSQRLRAFGLLTVHCRRRKVPKQTSVRPAHSGGLQDGPGTAPVVHKRWRAGMHSGTRRQWRHPRAVLHLANPPSPTRCWANAVSRGVQVCLCTFDDGWGCTADTAGTAQHGPRGLPGFWQPYSQRPATPCERACANCHCTPASTALMRTAGEAVAWY